MLDLVFENVPLFLIVAGLVLMVLEAISPGAHLIVGGVALLGAGLVGLLFPTVGPIVLAVLVFVIGAAAMYGFQELDIYGGSGTARTRDSASLSGQTGYVTETVTTRDGEVKLDEGGFNPFYSARSTSGTIEEGTEVIVLDPGGGNVLTVESIEAIGRDDIDRELARDRASRSTSEGRTAGDGDGNGSTDAAANESAATETEKSN